MELTKQFDSKLKHLTSHRCFTGCSADTKEAEFDQEKRSYKSEKNRHSISLMYLTRHDTEIYRTADLELLSDTSASPI